MRISRLLVLFLIAIVRIETGISQTPLEGYVFEQNNRGFLQQAKVTIYELPDNIVRATMQTDTFGAFSVKLAPGRYRVFTQKDVFYDRQDTVKIGGEKIYLKIEMRRKPGYLFDASIAESRDNPDQMVDAISGANIEIYNRTKHKPELILTDHPNAFFQHTLEQGNHYTMLIRKPGYLVKRIEAYVNIKGCILCVDGVRSVNPGVSENLTAGNTMGTLLANIEMDKAKINKRIQIQNIYYDYDKWDIRADASEQLDKVVTLMKDNPGLSVELGSHTDSRGNDAYNLKLSERRAAAAVAYIISEGVDSARITSKGYGETQLVNRCKNGVECTEGEHQQNRRTELRITGVSDEKRAWQTLEQIVTEEEKAQLSKDKKKSTDPKTDIGTAKGAGETTVKDDVISGIPAPTLSGSGAEIIPAFSKLAPNYAGYAVELLQSDEQTPADHPFFRGWRNVYWRKEKDGKYSYFLCELGPKQKAQEFFRARVKPYNKEAQLVYFGRSGKKYQP
jgi:outer membrane protein OmpA-like peptidoglycan-associated protein